MTENKNIRYYLAFLIWPFGTLLYALKNYREPISRILFVLAISFLGFTTKSFGDLERYEEWFYIYRGQNIQDLIISYLNFQVSDIYSKTISILIGLIFNTHHFYFAVLYGIYAYLLSGVILKFARLLPRKINHTTLLLLIGFALFYSIRSIISVRFYTGGLFYLFMMLNYIFTKKNKYLIFSLFTPLFHFGLSLLLLVSPLLLLLRKKYWLTLGIVIFSLAIGQSSVVNFIEKIAESNEETFIESSYKSYAADEGRSRLEERYRQGAIGANWKLTALNKTRDFLWYYIVAGILIVFIERKKLLIFKQFSDIFILVMLILSASNIMLNISNGNRYIFIYLFLAFGLFLLIYARRNVSNIFRFYIYGLIPLALAYGAMSLYASNEMFSFMFFITNYPIAIFLN